MNKVRTNMTDFSSNPQELYALPVLDSNHSSDHTFSDPVEFAQFFELNRTINTIKFSNFSKIALQFPDELLLHASLVVQSLKAQSPSHVEFFVLADSTYGSCCVDEVAAQHVNADLIVHYGRACLSLPAATPVLFVFGKQYLDLQLCADQFTAHYVPALSDSGNSATDGSIALLADVAYQHHLGPLSTLLTSLGHAVTAYPVPPAYGLPTPLSSSSSTTSTTLPAHVPAPAPPLAPTSLKRTFPPTSRIFYIGPESLSLTNLVMENARASITSYSPPTGPPRLESPSVNRLLARRYRAVQRARDADAFGIVVGAAGSGDDDLIAEEKVLGEMPEDVVRKTGERGFGVLRDVLVPWPKVGGPLCHHLIACVPLRSPYSLFPVHPLHPPSPPTPTRPTFAAHSLPLLSSLLRLFRAARRKHYVLSLGRPTPSKLANLHHDVDCFVVCACGENSIAVEEKEVGRAVVTPGEVAVALAGVEGGEGESGGEEEQGEEVREGEGDRLRLTDNFVEQGSWTTDFERVRGIIDRVATRLERREAKTERQLERKRNAMAEAEAERERIDPGGHTGGDGSGDQRRRSSAADPDAEPESEPESELPHFSLVSGVLKRTRRDDGGGGGGFIPASSAPSSSLLAGSATLTPSADLVTRDTSRMAVSKFVASIGSRFEERTFRGLETRLGDDEPAVVQMGRSGVASGYEGED
ncbi:Diphthamide biosynthesis protein 2 [Gonapodya sp. JEL0774]|nr:Diphthamide biosynthesis protein 2 [Gonapodya sp. JEL0774]